MSHLPTGTLTLVFTDVEGSTTLLRAHGSGYAELLAEHRRLLRDAFALHGGVEVDTQGDAFFFVFRAAGDAAAAALDGQTALAATPVRVRIGLHTGEPLATDEGYVGIDVHHAARVAACGHGGQIVVSASTRALLADVELVDLGEHRLKDLGEPERLFQLGAGAFAPLKTLDATNLPLASSSLVGRERELAEVLALLANGSREVTVTGTGGTGKTRFGLQVAAELVGAFRDGVFWVPLAAVADPELVEPEIAQTLGARDSLAGFLHGKEMLLLLDNFEHLLAAASSVGALLAGASGLRVLATSRSPLHLSVEREYPLDPLTPLDAERLFVQRASAIGRDLEQDEPIAAICRRLDGLPLAIELAAARTKLLTPETLLERLDYALPILTGGARDAPERQRTLRATIAWSYDLLDEPSRDLFARLSVFAGGFPFDAAEEVCDADIDQLAALVDASLLKAIGDDRFLLLDTIREYAAGLIDEAGESEIYRRRHADYFSTLAENAYAGRFEREVEWASRLERDHDDLRSALDWLTSDGDDEAAMRLAGALGWFWLSHAHLAEGARRLEAVLDTAVSDERACARALTAAGQLLARLGNAERGRARLDDAIAAWERLADDRERVNALDELGWLLVYAANDEPGALRAFDESLATNRSLGDRRGETRALVGVCQVLVALGDVERAEALSRELLDLACTHDDLRAEHFAHHFLADCALIAGECEVAEERYRRSLEAALPLGDLLETSFEVQGMAMAWAGLGRPERALVLAAAVEALWESLGTSPSVRFWDELLDRYVGATRRELGTSSQAYWNEGRALKFDDAVELALATGRPDEADSAD